MDLRTMVERLGGSKAVARVAGVTPGAVNQWVYQGQVPKRHVGALVELAAERGLDYTREQVEEAA